jgi:hypothetical protein
MGYGNGKRDIHEDAAVIRPGTSLLHHQPFSPNHRPASTDKKKNFSLSDCCQSIVITAAALVLCFFVF